MLNSRFEIFTYTLLQLNENCIRQATKRERFLACLCLKSILSYYSSGLLHNNNFHAITRWESFLISLKGHFCQSLWKYLRRSGYYLLAWWCLFTKSISLQPSTYPVMFSSTKYVYHNYDSSRFLLVLETLSNSK